MTEREWSVEEIIESLHQWDSAFYSDTETKWLMSKAADALERKQSMKKLLDEMSEFINAEVDDWHWKETLQGYVERLQAASSY